jgi:hypothetical protein
MRIFDSSGRIIGAKLQNRIIGRTICTFGSGLVAALYNNNILVSTYLSIIKLQPDPRKRIMPSKACMGASLLHAND